jgi:lysozyme
MITRNLQPAIDLIKAFEGLKDGDPTSIRLDPYLCPAGYWTIGWGHVVLDPAGKQLRGADNKQRAREVYPHGISLEDAAVLLRDDVRRFAAGVFRAVTRPVTDNEFCAMVSFAFNIGFGAFKKSTLLKLVNKGEMSKVPDQFMRWTKIDGRESIGLIRRRKAEVNLWERSY